MVYEESISDAVNHKEIFRLWIDDEWYIPVDTNGHCESMCAEGSLGFIVQLLSRSDKTFGRALKIPRLVAETDRENAYIAELLTQELAAVREVFLQDGATQGLLGALDTDNRLKKPIVIQTNEDAHAWHEALLLMRFEKGQNPYFCLYRPDNGDKYPPTAQAPDGGKGLLDKIRNASRSVALGTGRSGEAWSQLVFLRGTPGGNFAMKSPPGMPDPGNSHLDRHADPAVEGGVQANSELAIYGAHLALATEKDSTSLTWFTCVPSVTYAWAPHTLQEAIGRNKRGGTWSIDQHLQLMEQICSGIKVLHNKGMLHADIRPANIVHLGEPEAPLDYYLSDYGSFAYTNTRPLRVEGKEPMGDTVVGPVVEGERLSPFYAPERGSGRERETADTAIVVMSESSPECIAIVGWKSEFTKLGLLDDASRPSEEASYYTEFINTRREQFQREGRIEHVLDTGDRVQLRDYIFELVDREEILGNVQVFRCSPKYWTIYHGRIAISENRDREACFSFPIPRVIELPQWSAATDIYSLGVLCLYSVYSDLLHRNTRWQSDIVQDGESESVLHQREAVASGSIPEETSQDDVLKSRAPFGNQAPPDVPRMQTNSKSSTVKLDEDFEVMLKYMADKSLFRAVWPQLEWLRHQIEKNLVEDERQKWTADTLANQMFQPLPEPKPREKGVAAVHTPAAKATVEAELRPDSQSGSGAVTKGATLKSETEKVISQITSTVPGIELLLSQLSERGASERYQLGPFVFFLHFVLSCLNRQDSLDEQHLEWVEEGWMKAPFCKDRHDRPVKGGAAAQALERLAQIRSLIKAGALKGLTSEGIAAFDLRPESEIRRELNALRDNIKQQGQQLAYADAERAKHAEEQSAHTELKAKWDKTQQELKRLQTASAISAEQSKANEERQKELERQLVDGQQRLAQWEAAVKALESSFNSAIEALDKASYIDLLFKRKSIVDMISAEFVKAERQRPVD